MLCYEILTVMEFIVQGGQKLFLEIWLDFGALKLTKRIELCSEYWKIESKLFSAEAIIVISEIQHEQRSWR